VWGGWAEPCDYAAALRDERDELKETVEDLIGMAVRLVEAEAERDNLAAHQRSAEKAMKEARAERDEWFKRSEIVDERWHKERLRAHRAEADRDEANEAWIMAESIIKRRDERIDDLKAERDALWRELSKSEQERVTCGELRKQERAERDALREAGNETREIVLSERNLQVLLNKVKRYPQSQCTIIKPCGTRVRAEPDDIHYNGRTPGAMHPIDEEAISEQG